MDKNNGGLALQKTLRDEFAGLAMQALIIAGGLEYDEKTLASSAYLLADVMLRAREQ